MFKINYEQVQQVDVAEGGAEKVAMRWVLSEKEGAENFALRVFTVAPGGNTPLHTHPWEHEVFVLKGDGIVVSGGQDIPIRQGDVIFVPSEEEHQFKNVSDADFEFICLIPIMKKDGCC